jgi:hypothetical protein
MPITTHEHQAELYEDPEHWAHVMESLLIPAIERAGFEAVTPEATGSQLIHATIIEQLVRADMVVCDLSALNANVLFELGVRTALDLPIALVKDKFLKLPFDTSGINTFHYDHRLQGWHLDSQRADLADHIRETVSSSKGANLMWQTFGLKLKATEPTSEESPYEAKIDLLVSKVDQLERRLSGDDEASRRDAMLRRFLKANPGDTIIDPAGGSYTVTPKMRGRAVVDAANAELVGEGLEPIRESGVHDDGTVQVLVREPVDPVFISIMSDLAKRHRVAVRLMGANGALFHVLRPSIDNS